jgi:hypothetical protein
VLPVSEPRHVNGEEFRANVRSLQVLSQIGMDTWRGASYARHETHDRQS